MVVLLTLLVKILSLPQTDFLIQISLQPKMHVNYQTTIDIYSGKYRKSFPHNTISFQFVQIIYSAQDFVLLLLIIANGNPN